MILNSALYIVYYRHIKFIFKFYKNYIENNKLILNQNGTKNKSNNQYKKYNN